MVGRRLVLIGNSLQLAALREMQQEGKLPVIPEGDELVLVEDDRQLHQVGDEVFNLPESFPRSVELGSFEVYDQGATGNAWGNSIRDTTMLRLALGAGLGRELGNGDWRFADSPKPKTEKPPLMAAAGPPRNRKERRRDQRVAAQLLKKVRKRTGREKSA